MNPNQVQLWHLSRLHIYMIPMSLISGPTVHFAARTCRLRCFRPALQEPLHAAGVLLYVHGGSVGGAGQDIQSLIVPLQLRLGLQGEVLELHQHLQEGNK